MPATTDVCIGYLSPGHVATCFHDSLCGVLQRHQIGSRISIQSGPGIVRARNQLVKAFLQTEQKYLWMLDSDMSFNSETFLGLLELVDELKVVGALTFGQDLDGKRVFPIAKRFTKFGLEDVEVEPGVMEAVTGAGCLMVDRQVFVDMAEMYPEPYVWFEHSSYGPQAISEDVVFCLRAMELGYPSHIATPLKTGHHKSRVVSEEHVKVEEPA